MNLLNNAYDAIDSLPEKWIRIEAKPKDSGVEIAVVDSGKKITPEVAQRMIEPFFTNKPVGKGAGLGLSISQGILQSHQGHLYLDPNYPHTRVAFWIPTSA